MALNKKYLTIKAFAEQVGVSVQSIYQRLKRVESDLIPYLKEIDGIKYIDAAAIDALYKHDNFTLLDEGELGSPEQTKAPEHTGTDSTGRLLDLLEAQLEDMRRQLKEKDKQIANQSEQITSLLARLEDSNRIINQQQQLTAMSIKQLAPADDDNAGASEHEIEEVPEEKKSFWARVFRKQ